MRLPFIIHSGSELKLNALGDYINVVSAEQE